MKPILFKPLFLILLLVVSCSSDDDMSIEKRAYIVGYDPCTINHHYRIGYVIITEEKDTLVTYSLSDKSFKMPASVLLNPNDTIYKIPESYFENYRNSVFFPNSLRYKYPVAISYSSAKENEMVYNLCTTDMIFLNFPQVIIKSITK